MSDSKGWFLILTSYCMDAKEMKNISIFINLLYNENVYYFGICLISTLVIKFRYNNKHANCLLYP